MREPRARRFAEAVFSRQRYGFKQAMRVPDHRLPIRELQKVDLLQMLSPTAPKPQ
jgi:hypothetical protein